MSENRPFVLSIAGFDPSGGAGVLADIKTFEQHQVTGFAIITANTIQTENEFRVIEWIDLGFVLRSIETFFQSYNISTVKIGIIPSFDYLSQIISAVKLLSPTTKIIWDPVLKSSTNFKFTTIEDHLNVSKIISEIDLITPNYNEIEILFPGFTTNKFWLQNELSTCILLKGGHNNSEIGVDRLFMKNEILDLFPSEKECSEKHGSGCVLSSSIAANLALNQSMTEACKNAKIYIEKYLSSTSTLIGYHYV
ncbi:hydroxymethylpyrimidine/phosphomethylpyrimidine kinase [Pseudomonas shirazensis]